MPLIKIKAEPTFKKRVPIPRHGQEPAEIEFTFKHRTRAEVDAWLKEDPNRSDVDFVLQSVEAWEFADPLDRTSVETLVENYQGAAKAIGDAYFAELRQVRIKN